MKLPDEEDFGGRIFQRRTKDILRFTESRVHLTEGVFRDELIQFRRSPWMIKPLQKWADDRVSRVLVLKGTGCGGTYVAEIGAAYFTAVRPRNVGYQIWTKEKADYLAGRFFAKCKAMPEYNRRLPKRAQATKNKVVDFGFPTTFTRVQEASETAAQSYRMDDMIADEPWQYPLGRLPELYKRTDGASPYYTQVAVSTAPRSPDHDINIDWLEGCQDEYHLGCPKCHFLFIPILGDESQKRYQMQVIQYDLEGSIDHQVTTCRLVCPNCSAEYYDKPSIRLDLLEGADYLPNNKDAPDSIYSCRWNSWVAWFVKFHELLREYLSGLEASKRGDNAKLEDYVIKREARAWQGVVMTDKRMHITGDYELVEAPHPMAAHLNYASAETIWIAPDWDLEEPESEDGYCRGRLASVDVQQERLWLWVAQASREDLGAQRLMWCGKVRTWAELDMLLEFMKVPPWQVGVDMGYERGGIEVPCQILAHDWTALRGVEDGKGEGFVWSWQDDDDTTQRDRLSYSPHSTWEIDSRKDWEPGMPTSINVYSWSHKRIMDMLWNLRNGEGMYWGLPRNLSVLEDDSWTDQERILNQLDSTRYMRKIAKTASNANSKHVPMSWQKKASNVRDDLWDCASMLLVMMTMQRFFTPKD